MTGAEEPLDQRFDDSEDLVQSVLHQADQSDLAGLLNRPGGHDSFSVGFLEVVDLLGGTSVLEQPSEGRSPGAAGVLIPGTKINVRVSKVAWKSALAMVPVIVSLITGPVGVVAILPGLIPLADEFREAITNLSDEEKAIVVALTALSKQRGRQPVTPEEVAAVVQRPASDVSGVLSNLAIRGVIKRSQDPEGYAAAF
jgi:hypothetical protein